MNLLSGILTEIPPAGYVGFYPPRPDEDEEVLTEANVKNGLILGLSVPVSYACITLIESHWSLFQAETYSASDNIRNRLIHENALSELEELMNQIFVRKAESIPPVP